MSLSPVDTPGQRAVAAAKPLSISIIVPVLNEALLIVNFLNHLRTRAVDAEIIVVDGGSSDGTPELAGGLCDRLIRTTAGRAVQMNAGAEAARGEVLWFLHADVEVPPNCLTNIRQQLADPKIVGGFFRIRLPESSLVYRLTDEFAHYAGILLGMRCGDHGIFCRRSHFCALGGFPEVPLMEDVEFFHRLQGRGRVVCHGERLVISPRRFENVGPIRVTLAFGVIGLLHKLGAPLPLLSRMYRRLCC